MNSDRIPFLATPGGKTETIARAVIAERKAAYKMRVDYLNAKPGVENLYGNDAGVFALVVKKGTVIDGWRVEKKHGSGPTGESHVLVPDGKKKATYASLKAELRALPSLPDAQDFSSRIGCPLQFANRRMYFSYYEIVGGQIIVAVPIAHKPDDAEESVTQFIPDDCVQLKHSEYWALKEKESSMGETKNLPLVS